MPSYTAIPTGEQTACHFPYTSHLSAPSYQQRPPTSPSISHCQAADATSYTYNQEPPFAKHDLLIEVQPDEKLRPSSLRILGATGWRKGLQFSVLGGFLVFLVNLTSLIVVLWKYGWTDGGLPMLKEAKCSETKKMSLWLHLLINILSTGLLGASNYNMQILSAPTRKEVDRAHAKGDWLDIGAPGLRNLIAGRIQGLRVWKWILLLISSLPLHLLYNSAVFTTIALNSYEALLVPESFVDGKTPFNSFLSDYDLRFGESTSRYSKTDRRYGAEDFARERYIHRNLRNWERLDTAACIRQYGQPFISDRHDLVLVTSTPGFSFAGRRFQSFHPVVTSSRRQPYEWMFGHAHATKAMDPRDHNIDRLISLGNWSPDGAIVDYCLSEKTEAQCTLHYHIPIMVIVVMCNCIKLVCMVWTLLSTSEDPLVTVGDAVSSFLAVPDEHSRNMCAASAFELEKPNAEESAWRYWDSRGYKWRTAATKTLWAMFSILAFLSIVAVASLLVIALSATRELTADTTFPALWRMGFGAVDASSLIGTDDYIMTKSEAGQVVIANIPQAVYSLIYLLFNNILTRMLLAYEWSHLSLKKKPLRVSSPIGKQRSTYFLQLPFRYALPLLTLSAIMHWLVSQGLFFVKFRVVAHGTPVDTSAHTLGWSAIAIIFVLICGSLMTLAVILLGFRSYPVGIPFARSCSRVIAAACHNQDGARVRLEALQWGDVGEGTTTGVRHCTFSDEVVRMPQEGVRYAGCAKDDMTRRNQGKRGSWE